MGATRYVAAISDEEFAKIAANLNFDMLASPNHGKFVYDGDFSRHAAAGHGAEREPGRRVHRGRVRGLLRLASGSPRSRPRSTAAATTSRSRTTGSPRAACSPARRSRSPRRRPPSGAARPAWRSTRTTTRPATTSTTSTSRLGADGRRRRARAGDAGRGPQPARVARRRRDRQRGEEVRKKAKARKAKRLSKARKATLGAYLGDRARPLARGNTDRSSTRGGRTGRPSCVVAVRLHGCPCLTQRRQFTYEGVVKRFGETLALAGSTSRSRRGRSSGCSGPTAPARPRSSGCSPRCSRRTRGARRSSGATWCTTPRPCASCSA